MKEELKESSVIFSDWVSSKDELNRIFSQYLSYKEAFSKMGIPSAPMKQSGERYAKTIHYLIENRFIDNFEEIVADLRATT